MIRPLRPLFAIPILALLLPVLDVPEASAFDLAGQQCRAAIFRTGTKLTKTALKAMADCHRLRVSDDQYADRDCNDLSQVDVNGSIANAQRKLAAVADRACGGDPAALLYEGCPAPCNAGTPTIANFADVAECLVCLAREKAADFGEEVHGTPVSPLQNLDERTCHSLAVKMSTKLFTKAMGLVAKCQSDAEASGIETIDACTQTGFQQLVQQTYDRTVAAVLKGCNGFMIQTGLMDPCGGASNFADLATCVADTTRDRAQEISALYLRLEGEPPVPTTTTTVVTTTTTLDGDASCPNAAAVTTFSRDSHQACTSNADCTTPRTCDTALGHCSTGTDLDIGWTGLAHDADSNDGSVLHLRLSCAGPAAPACGQCDVAGIDPSAGDCRCANDPRATCDRPFLSDWNDCGGAACQCYVGAPTPQSSGGTPYCVVNRLAENVAGTVDVDSGAVDLHARMRSVVHLGETLTRPCPTCGGRCSNDQSACSFDDDCDGAATCVHDVAGDGQRDGTCIGGRSDGLSCDASATNASLPARASAPGGASYSLDCMPSVGRNIAGAGLAVDLDQSTGVVSLASGLDCDGDGAGTESCPCRLCSKDASVVCSTDSECSGQGGYCSLIRDPAASSCATNTDCASVNVGPCIPVGATKRCSGELTIACVTNTDCEARPGGECLPSTCSSNRYGEPPLPNQCDGLACTDLGGGEGRCTMGPDERYCDGVVNADGSGILACNVNSDCLPGVLGIDGGHCGVVERRACFPGTVAASGRADPAFPLTVATYCSPPTANVAVNSVLGLPGPVRERSQKGLVTFCANAPHPAYVPGVGGCP